jgi:hypothetical protein
MPRGKEPATHMEYFQQRKLLPRAGNKRSRDACTAQRTLVFEPDLRCDETLGPIGEDDDELDAQSCSAARAEAHKAAMKVMRKAHKAVMKVMRASENTPPRGNVGINALLVHYLGGSGSVQLFEEGCTVIVKVCAAQYMWRYDNPHVVELFGWSVMPSQRAVTHSMLLFFYYLHKGRSTENPPSVEAAALACCQLAFKLQQGNYAPSIQDVINRCESEPGTEHTRTELVAAEHHILQVLNFDIDVPQALEQFQMVIESIAAGLGLPPLNAEEIAELLVRGTYKGNTWTSAPTTT